MVDFVKTAFRGLFKVILWLTLIACTVGGAIISQASEGNPIPGILIGLVVGMFINIVFGGLGATIINIDENVEIIRNNLYKISDTNINTSISPINPAANSGETWECKKCNEINPIASSMCKGCGAYK